METTSTRLPWGAVDAAVRDLIEEAVGAPVVTARNERGGYGPGLAARCRLADGRGVFVKAVSPDQNPVTPDMTRREIDVARRLPASIPAPRLLWSHDDGWWVVAVFEEVDGDVPGVPWHADELRRVLRGVDDLAAGADPNPIPGLRSLAAALDGEFEGWRRLAGGEDTAGLDPWCVRHLDDLAELESAWVDASMGTALVHVDVRADNVLLTADGGVTFVDWAHASVGASWTDVVFFAPSVELQGGPTCDEVVAASRIARAADPDAVIAVAAALGGYFVRQSRQPPPIGLPAVRRFQADQGEVVVRWLRSRTGWT